jgi:hypothetical protein
MDLEAVAACSHLGPLRAGRRALAAQQAPHSDPAAVE